MKHIQPKFFVLLILLQVAFSATAQTTQKYNLDIARLIFGEPNLEYAHAINNHWDYRLFSSARFFSKLKTGESETDFVENQRNNEPISYKLSRPLANFGPFKPLHAFDLGVGMRYTINPQSKLKFFVQPMFDWYLLRGYKITDEFKIIDETVSTCCNSTTDVTLTQRYIHQTRLIEGGANRSLVGISAQTGVTLDLKRIAIEARVRAGLNSKEIDSFYEHQGFSRKYLKFSLILSI
jgi:hypothetical protein